MISIDGEYCDILRAVGLDSAPIGIYEDALQNTIHIVTELTVDLQKKCKSFQSLPIESSLDLRRFLNSINL